MKNSDPEFLLVSGLEVCVPECHFPGTGFFPEKSGKFPVPSIWEHPLPGPVSVPPFGTGHFPSCLSPQKETGIPKACMFYLMMAFISVSHSALLLENSSQVEMVPSKGRRYCRSRKAVTNSNSYFCQRLSSSSLAFLQMNPNY